MKKKLKLVIGAFVCTLLLIATGIGINSFSAAAAQPGLKPSQVSFSKINADKAWDITAGSHEVKVGVMDSGIANHGGFGANLLPGYDFFHDNDITTDDESYVYHGTGVAGIIGAHDNSRGISGICWDVSLIPLQISSDYSNIDYNLSYLENVDAAIAAIEHATKYGIHIINFSGGFYDKGTGIYATTEFRDDKQRSALEKAIKEYPGLLICAAGNDNTDLNSLKSLSRTV